MVAWRQRLPCLFALMAFAGACTKEGDLLFELSPDPIAPTAWTTSWVGNGFAAAPSTQAAWVSFVVGGIFVSGDGTIYANAQFDYGGREFNIYRNGALVDFSRDTAALGGGSGAVACDDKFCYHAIGRYTNQPTRPSQGFRRIRRDGRSLSSGGELYLRVGDHNVAGIATSGGLVFVSDDSSELVHVFDSESMNELRSWPVPRAGVLTSDGEGGVWIVSRPASETQVAQLLHFSGMGVALGAAKSLEPAQKPTALVREATGNLLLADAGPDQSVVRLDVSNTAADKPILIGRVGVKGGIFDQAGRTGKVGSLRFHDPVGLGVDAAGNITVASVGGGSVIETYSPQGGLRERLSGVTRVSGAALDATADGQLFTMNQRFTFDYDQPPGQGWKYEAFTADPARYPADPRLHLGPDWEAPWIRHINGQVYQFQAAADASSLSVFRFDSSHTAETAVPTAMFALERIAWVPNQPDGPNGWHWSDRNSNGNFDADEFLPWNARADKGVTNWHVDERGDLWLGRGTSGLEHVPLQRMQTGGTLTYDLAGAQMFAPPALLTEIKRALYEASTDRLLVSGFSLNNPGPVEFKSIGTEVFIIDDFTKSSASKRPAFRLTFPATTQSGDAEMTWLDWAGDLVFVATINGAETCRVYTQSTGSFVQTIRPGAEVGGTGSPLITRHAMAVLRRQSGEYVVTRPDQNHGKLHVIRL